MRGGWIAGISISLDRTAQVDIQENCTPISRPAHPQKGPEKSSFSGTNQYVAPRNRLPLSHGHPCPER